MNAYFDGLRKYATFSGRATRSQFWLFFLFLFIFVTIGLVIDDAMGTTNRDGGLVAGLIFVAHLLPYSAVTVRRLHDIDRSGWWFWIALVPLVGSIVLIVFLCTGSTPGANRFGLPAGNRVPLGGSAAGFAGSGSASTVERLEKLASLRASGALDETEFNKMKAELLAQQGR